MFLDKLINQTIEEKNVKQLPHRPYGETNIGKHREKNEDAILIFDSINRSSKKELHNVFAVADGVGGQPNGEVAANTITSSIFDYASHGQYLDQNTLKKINSRIRSGASTLVLAQQLDTDINHYHIYSVGDSSALLLDQKSRTLIEVTKRDENPTTGRLTQAMGQDTGTAHLRQANESSVLLKEGQTLLLATDGFTKYIDKGRFPPIEILKLRQQYPDESNFVKALIDRTNSLGGTDNITIISIPHQSQK